MYNGQIETKQAESLAFSAVKEETHSNLLSDSAGRAITRQLQRGTVTITFADRDNPDIIDEVLGMLLQDLPK